jgi:FAD/FMN-containing dehydrogenase
MTRREFLRGAALAAAASILPQRRLLESESAKRHAIPAGAAAISGLANRIRGRLILPSDPGYDSARRVFSWNPATDKRPALLVCCAGRDDVRAAIEYAHRANLEVAIRSGGHDVLGKSVCEGGMVIDLSPMKGIAIDPKRRVANVEAGVTAGELNAAAAKYDLAVALGCNPLVGISGLTLGGGLGWLLGKHGAACDNLRSIDLVSADAQNLHASHDENPDLFWALHGGGGNFGVVTNFEFEMYPLDAIAGGFIVYPREKAAEFYRFYGDYMKVAPDELAIETSLDARGILVMVCYSGDMNRSEHVLEPLRKFGSFKGSLARMPYVGLQTPPLLGHIADAIEREFRSLADRLSGHESRRPFIYWKGGSLNELNHQAIEILTEASRNAPPWCSIGLGHYMHGAVCRADPASTPLIREQHALSYFINASWTEARDGDRAVRWVNDYWKNLQPLSANRSYVNYLSADDEPSVVSAYGANYERLAALKSKYDPSNFLHLNRNIRPGPTPIQSS